VAVLLGVGAAELNHEIGDGSVHVKTVVEASGTKVKEVSSGDWHLVGENFYLEGSCGGLETDELGHVI